MPWYTLTDAKNEIKFKETSADIYVDGIENISEFIFGSIVKKALKKSNTVVLGIDGFLGAQFEQVVSSVKDELAENEIEVQLFDVSSLFKFQAALKKIAKPYNTKDTSFGRVCLDKKLSDLMDSAKIEKLKKDIAKIKKADSANDTTMVVICYGVGAAIPALRRSYDQIFYLDIIRESLIKRMEEKKLIPVGAKEPDSIFWKELYYFYCPILHKHKKYVFSHMDWYMNDEVTEEIKMVSRKFYDKILSTVVKYPLRFKRIFMPGPWGGFKFRDMFNMPELAHTAWNIELSGCDSSLVIDLGQDREIDVQFYNLYMQYPIDVIGPYCHKKYPGNFPLQVGLQDGYFPKKVPHERRSMPLHLHPDTKYNKKHFNESLGRYEVYYIVEAFEGANTMHGFFEDADLEQFKKEIIRSEKTGKPFDWSKYVKCWPSEDGDLYIISAGTVHGTGGNQIVLEMDTGPSINDTEYSFFIYDYTRTTWDDKKKSMTAKPSALQVKHGLEQTRWNRREKWIADNARQRAKVFRFGKDWSEDRFDSYAPMPYHIERMHFKKKIDTDTEGKFCHFLCLTKGKKAKIIPQKNPERAIELEYLQCTVIPACFGKYKCVSVNGDECTVTKQRWKIG